LGLLAWAQHDVGNFKKCTIGKLNWRDWTDPLFSYEERWIVDIDCQKILVVYGIWNLYCYKYWTL